MQHPHSASSGPFASNLDISVRRHDGTKIPARLRFLRNDGCEIACDCALEAGEQVSIEICRMGWIRARVRSHLSGIVEAEFIKECPV